MTDHIRTDPRDGLTQVELDSLMRVAQLSRDSAYVALGSIANGTFIERILDSVASLVVAGWLVEWDEPLMGAGVCLSAMAARSLGMTLAPPDPGAPEDEMDYGRWVEGTYRDRPRRVKRSLLISEADLTRERDTPMDQISTETGRERERMRDSGDGVDRKGEAETDAMLSKIREWLSAGKTADEIIVMCGKAAEYAMLTKDLDVGWTSDEILVLTGHDTWPLVGQDRWDGPFMQVGTQKDCPVCRGRKLAANEFCASPGCERSGWDYRIAPAIRLKVQESRKPDRRPTSLAAPPKPRVVASADDGRKKTAKKGGKKSRKARKGGMMGYGGSSARGKHYGGGIDRGGLKGGLEA